MIGPKKSIMILCVHLNRVAWQQNSSSAVVNLSVKQNTFVIKREQIKFQTEPHGTRFQQLRWAKTTPTHT